MHKSSDNSSNENNKKRDRFLSNNKIIHANAKLGSKSIFFDPELNPEGIAPTSFKKNYIYYKNKKRNFVENNDYDSSIVKQVPLPEAPLPKYFKFYKTSSVITNDEVITSNLSTMIPISVYKNRKRRRSSNENPHATKK